MVSVKHANFLHNEVPGISLPEEIRKRNKAAGEDGVKAGVEITVELVEQLKAWVGGVYIMHQFHKYDMVAEIIEAIR